MTGDGLYGFDDENLILGSTDDKADIDGNGTPGQVNDKNVFHNYLIDQIPYLPAHWGFSISTQKTDWLQKMLAIDLTDQIPPGPGWDCNQYAMQLRINFPGIRNIQNSGINPIYDTTNNARFNIPLYSVSTRTSLNVPHKINYVLTGEPGNVFSQGKFPEPQTDQLVIPGSQSLNQFANIDGFCYYWNTTLEQWVYGPIPVIDYTNINTSPTVSWQHPELVVDKPAKWGYKFIGGQGPDDITLLYQIAFENSNPLPSISGDVTGKASWATRFYSDVTSPRGTTNDSIFFNFDVERDFWAISDSSDVIDTTYMTNDNRFTCDSAQSIKVRDWEFPIYTFVPSGSMLYSVWLANGVAASEGTDNCGYNAITRNLISLTQGSDPNNCDFYEFTETNKDDNEDPTGNLTDTTFTIPVELDPTQLTIPQTFYANYGDPLDPDNTGGWATGTNEAGVTVNISYSDSITQDPDTTLPGHYVYELWRKWFGVTDPCQDTTWGYQVIYVDENEPPILTFVPNDTVVPIGGCIDTACLGAARGEDPISGVPPTPHYWDNVIYQGYDSIYIKRDHWVVDIQGTSSADTGHQYITQMVMPGIPEEPKKQPIVIYPNPTQNLVHVKFNDIKARPEKIKITNLLGKTLEEIMVDPVEEVEYNASHLPDGMYIMSIGNKKRKFIKN